ncbi:MAG: hypothetical protein ACRER2_11820, partial [Methylococcales bacterium]
YGGASFGTGSGFFNVRPCASATGQNPSLRLRTNNVTAMTINRDQNVGIGTVTPAGTLDILGTTLLTNTSTALTGTAATFLASGDNAANTGNLIKATVSGTSAATVPIMATNAGTGLSMRVNDDGTDTDSTPFAITATGNVGIGDDSPDTQFEISHPTAPVMTMSDPGLAHGMTAILPTDSFLQADEQTDNDGGLRLVGASDAVGQTGLLLMGVIGDANPTDSIPALRLSGSKKFGASITNLGALETAIQFEGVTGTNYMTILGDGKVGIGTVTPAKNFHVIGTVGLDTTLTDATGTPGSICYDTSTFEMTKNNALTCTVSDAREKKDIYSLSGLQI